MGGCIYWTKTKYLLRWAAAVRQRVYAVCVRRDDASLSLLTGLTSHQDPNPTPMLRVCAWTPQHEFAGFVQDTRVQKLIDAHLAAWTI